MSGLILLCHIKCDYAACRIDFSDKLHSMLIGVLQQAVKVMYDCKERLADNNLGKERDASE